MSESDEPATPDSDAERAFLELLRTEINNEDARLIYADWLEERGDSRARFLRVEIEFHRLPPNDKRRQRLRLLLRQLRLSINDFAWQAAVCRSAIENCQSEYESQCPFHWEKLDSTDDPSIRSCSECRQPVYYCTDMVTAHEYASDNKCVVIDCSVARWPNDMARYVH